MKNVYLHKAETLKHQQDDWLTFAEEYSEVETVKIMIHDRLIPNEGLSVDALNTIFEKDAHDLAEVLKSTLPSGTLLRLSEMLRKQTPSKAV